MATESAWSKPLPELCRELSSSEKGLSSQEAHRRLLVHGHNTIPDRDRRAWTGILRSQFENPLLLILIAASLLSTLFAEECFLALGGVCISLDTSIILAVILVSVALGFAQEYKAESALSELKKYFSSRAVALRNGERVQVDARELVPGDIIFMALGDIIPADVRIMESKGIAVSQSVLTGESREIVKTARAAPQKASGPQDTANGLFMGSTVVGGYATCMVVATGQHTFFGKTAATFSAKVPESDFQKGTRRFGGMVLKVTIAIALFIFAANVVLGHGEKDVVLDSALFALAIAVGIAPEALPIVITITLSSGALLLAKSKVVTKRLAAIEDLGNMDVLCTDKTGTLTEEGLHFEKYVDLDRRDSHDVFQYAFLCNAAVGTAHVKGNPLDVAIRTTGLRKGIDVSRFQKISEIPFDYERRRMGVVAKEGPHRYLIVKGAPESVLAQCSHVRMDGKLYPVSRRRAAVKRMISEYHSEGYSSLAVAYRQVEGKKSYSPNDERNLIFIGFVLFSNPPKTTVRATLSRLRALGIRPILLTGDDAVLAGRLCQKVGFPIEGGRVVLGSEIQKMSAEKLAAAVERCSVFARLTPDQKLLVVEALKANGHVVGFMGDGINDAPSLRTADVGISVDGAADVAKGASHIILLRKGLNVVADGVEEGRKIFANITKYILNTMSANQGNMITIALSSFFLPILPLLPSQILLNNILSDIPLMSVASDKVDADSVRKPQRWDIKYILKFMLFFGAISTFFDLLLILMMAFVLHTPTDEFRTAWFLESVLSEMVIVFSLRTHLPFFKSAPSLLLVAATLGSIALSFAVIYYAPVAVLFRFVPIGPQLFILTASILVGYFAATEIGKVYFYDKVAPLKN